MHRKKAKVKPKSKFTAENKKIAIISIIGLAVIGLLFGVFLLSSQESFVGDAIKASQTAVRKYVAASKTIVSEKAPTVTQCDVDLSSKITEKYVWKLDFEDLDSEGWIQGWGKPYKYSNFEELSKFELDSNVKHSGKYSLKISAKDPTKCHGILGMTAGGYGGGVVGVEPNTEYIVSYWIKGENVKDLNGNLAILQMLGKIIDTNTPLSGPYWWAQFTYPTPINKEWEHRVGNFTIPADKDVLSPVILFQLGSGTVWLDDIIMMKKSDYDTLPETSLEVETKVAVQASKAQSLSGPGGIVPGPKEITEKSGAPALHYFTRENMIQAKAILRNQEDADQEYTVKASLYYCNQLMQQSEKKVTVLANSREEIVLMNINPGTYAIGDYLLKVTLEKNTQFGFQVIDSVEQVIGLRLKPEVDFFYGIGTTSDVTQAAAYERLKRLESSNLKPLFYQATEPPAYVADAALDKGMPFMMRLIPHGALALITPKIDANGLKAVVYQWGLSDETVWVKAGIEISSIVKRVSQFPSFFPRIITSDDFSILSGWNWAQRNKERFTALTSLTAPRPTEFDPTYLFSLGIEFKQNLPTEINSNIPVSDNVVKIFLDNKVDYLEQKGCFPPPDSAPCIIEKFENTKWRIRNRAFTFEIREEENKLKVYRYDLYPSPFPSQSKAGAVPVNNPWLRWNQFLSKDVLGEYNKAVTQGVVEANPAAKIGPIPGGMGVPLFYTDGGHYPVYNFGKNGFNMLSYYMYLAYSRPLLAYLYSTEMGRMGNRDLPMYVMPEAYWPEKSYTWNTFYLLMAAGADGINYFIDKSSGVDAPSPEFWEVAKTITGPVAQKFGSLFVSIQPEIRKVGLLIPFTQASFQTDYPLTHGFCSYANLLLSGVDVEPIAEEEILAGRLKEYDAVVLSRVDWLRQDVFDILQASNIPVIVDSVSKVGLTGNMVKNAGVEFMKSGGCAYPDYAQDYADPVRLQEIRTAMNQFVTPEVKISSDTMIYKKYKGGDTKYLWLVDVHTKKEYVDLAKMLYSLPNNVYNPQTRTDQFDYLTKNNIYSGQNTATVSVAVLSEVIVVDVISGKKLLSKYDGQKVTFDISIPRLKGKLIAFYPVEPNFVNIDIPSVTAIRSAAIKAIINGNQLTPIKISVKGAYGSQINAIFPIQIEIVDPFGKKHAYSRYAATDGNGQYTLPILLGENAPKGSWTLTVKELSMGLVNKVTFNVI